MSHLDGGGQEQALIPARRPSSLSLSADVVPLPSKRRRLAPAENRNFDFRLKRQLAGYQKLDPPPA